MVIEAVIEDIPLKQVQGSGGGRRGGRLYGLQEAQASGWAAEGCLGASCPPTHPPLTQRIFCDLERETRPDCILSTNTSTIDINLVGAKTKAAGRIVGAHFFSPAHIMPLLEIVRTEHTSKQVRGERGGRSREG